MPQLFVPLTGAFKAVAGSGFNTFGENLDRPQWQGAEIGQLATFPDLWGAVSEAEFHDWIIGVHHPLYIEGGHRWVTFFHKDRTALEESLAVAESAAQEAHHIGARYILFHFPWPGFQMPGVDHAAQGWHFAFFEELVDAAEWSEAETYEVSRRIFERLSEIQAKERIKIVLEQDGPNPHFFAGDLYGRLFSEFPDLSLCLDTGRLGLLAKTHGQDPLELTRRWLPWIRHLHLHTSLWEPEGRFQSHIPTTAAHTAERWPAVTPAADIARMVVEAQPRCQIVLEHNPGAVSPEELEAAHEFARSLTQRR